jgi:hypothetical protein
MMVMLQLPQGSHPLPDSLHCSESKHVWRALGSSLKHDGIVAIPAIIRLVPGAGLMRQKPLRKANR